MDEIEKVISQDLERSVLSSYLWDNDTFISNASNRANFTGSNVAVYDSIRKLINAEICADIVSVTQECMEVGVRASYISEISDHPQTTNIDYAVKKLEDLALKRSAMLAWAKGSRDIVGNADTMDVIQATNNAIEFPESTDITFIDDAVGGFFDKFVAAKKSGESTKIMTGISSLDDAIGGFDKSEVVVVAARPGHGKTSSTMNWAKHWGNYGIPGAIYSLEMSNDQLVGRMSCDVGSIDGKYIMKDYLEYDNPEHKEIWSDLRSATRQIASMPILIDDQPCKSIQDIRVSARRAKRKTGIRWVIIDYVQLVKGWDRDGQGPKSEIMAEIKAMSKELDISVIVVSQMNREIEKRAQKIPKSSDLRDAGSIEQVADHIIFCVIPSKFPDAPEADLADKGKAIFFITKARRGEIGPVFNVRWEGRYFRYYSSHGGY